MGAKQWRLSCGILLIAATGWAQGFRFTGDQLRVDEAHWRDWNFAQGTVEFDAQGSRSQYVQVRSNWSPITPLRAMPLPPPARASTPAHRAAPRPRRREKRHQPM